MNYIDISLPRLAVALGLIVVAIFISRWRSLGLERDLLWGAFRAAAQLILIGYILLVLFAHERPWWVGALLLIMIAAAGWTSTRRITHGPRPRVLFPYAVLSIVAGALIATVPIFALVVRPKPWFEARYLVPIGGMMLSSAMNVVTQVFERLFALAKSESGAIEQMLSLGASPQQALQSHARSAIRAAMIPTINGLLTVGLVALPGMMTGQILGGTPPEQAVRYQIVIMYQLVAVAAVSAVFAAEFARKLLFTPRAQLISFEQR